MCAVNLPRETNFREFAAFGSLNTKICFCLQIISYTFPATGEPFPFPFYDVVRYGQGYVDYFNMYRATSDSMLDMLDLVPANKVGAISWRQNFTAPPLRIRERNYSYVLCRRSVFTSIIDPPIILC